MKVEASVDIGNNLTSLLERLAQQIGTTADKVFPWYVHQAYLEGVTTLAVIGIFLLIAVPVFIVSVRKYDPDGRDMNGAWVACVISGFCLAFTLLIGGIEGADAARKIMNPNYYAMQMFMRDIGRLSGG